MSRSQESTTRNFEKSSLLLKASIATGLSIAALTGCAPGEAPQTTETTSASPEAPTKPDAIVRFEAISAEKFVEEARKEQLKYAYYAVQERQSDYETAYAPDVDHEGYYVSPLTEGSADNSDKQIIDTLNRTYQTAFLPATGGRAYDGEAGKKILSGVFVNNDPALNLLDSAWFEQDLHAEAAEYGGARVAPLFEIVDPNNTQGAQANYDCLDDYGTKLQCRSIAVKFDESIDPKQETYHIPVVLTPFEDVSGSEKNTWLVDQTTASN